jgi:hypothetical protein
MRQSAQRTMSIWLTMSSLLARAQPQMGHLREGVGAAVP